METIDFLLSRPFALLVVLAIGAAIGMAAERIGNNLNAAERKAYWRGRNDAKDKATVVQVQSGKRSANAAEADFAADQLKLVSTATFTARALRKAGIGYHEVVAGHTTPGELRKLVEKLVPAG